MFDRFTEKAIRVLLLAKEEAHRSDHSLVGTEQLLLGLMLEGTGVAATVLKSVGIPDVVRVRKEVEAILGRGAGSATELVFTETARRGLDNAQAEARHLGHHYVGTEHLLLGLLTESQGTVSQVLESFKIDPVLVRAEVLNCIGTSTSNSQQSAEALSVKSREPSDPSTDAGYGMIDPAADRILRAREDWESELSNISAQITSILDTTAYEGRVNPAVKATLREYLVKIDLFSALLSYALTEARELSIQIRTRLEEGSLTGGDVLNALVQLPETEEPGKPSIKEHLLLLHRAIETDSALSLVDRAEALEQVKILAELGQSHTNPQSQRIARTALKILWGTIASLPLDAQFVEVVHPVLRAIAQQFKL